jgi:ClpP class serine protease
MHWLLEPSALQALLHTRRFATPEARTQWDARQAAESLRGGSDGGLPRNMTVAGSTAEIRIEGILTKRPDFFAAFFGGGNTTYTSIRAALSIAESNPQIREVVLFVDSPGGSADGLFETLDAIAAFRASSGKKIRVRAENAQSAAYGIAAAGGNIEASGRGATFGSIGTAIAYFMDEHIIELTNTDSPDKRPDLTTAEGKAVVVKYLDQLNFEFVRSIAQGRGVDSKTVTEDYGRGASMTAVAAKSLGLIDKISTTAPRAVPSKGKTMSEEQTDNRAAIDAAKLEGVEQERDRVRAHLAMGEGCGDLSIALEAIRSGASMTQEINARYLSAGMNRSDRSRRQTESNTAEAALKGVDAATTAPVADLGDQVVTVLENKKSHVRHVK